MNLKSFYVSWVDLLLVIVLLWGIHRGQKRGISEEVLVLAQWMVMLVVAGFGYPFIGAVLAQTGIVGLLWGNVLAYIGLVLLVKFGFSAFTKSVGEKLLASETFGRGEYYLGMFAGGVRYMLVMVFCFALLNAPQYSRAERAASKKYQEVNYGSVLFPTTIDLQDAVFAKSFSGQFTAKYLSYVLIKPTAPSNKSIRDLRKVNARERAVHDIMNNR